MRSGVLGGKEECGFTCHQDRDNQLTPGFIRSLEAMGCEIRSLVVKKTVATMVNKDVMHIWKRTMKVNRM